MSAINSKIIKALFPVVVAALMATACDSTAPSAEQETPDATMTMPLPGDSAAIRPNLVSLGTPWVEQGWSRPWVGIPAGAVSCTDWILRGVKVEGMQAGVAKSGFYSTQAIHAEVSLFHYTSQGWVEWSPRQFTGTMTPQSKYNYFIPPVSFISNNSGMPLEPGYYTVQATLTWGFAGSTVAKQGINFNSSSDYRAFGASRVYSGYQYCYMP